MHKYQSKKVSTVKDQVNMMREIELSYNNWPERNKDLWNANEFKIILFKKFNKLQKYTNGKENFFLNV